MEGRSQQNRKEGKGSPLWRVILWLVESHQKNADKPSAQHAQLGQTEGFLCHMTRLNLSSQTFSRTCEFPERS